MSSCPGLTLEDFVEWNYDLVVEDDRPDVNFSLHAAELFGTIQPRPRMKSQDFARVIALFEPYRERTEELLMDFDEEEQSWRSYSTYCFEFIPNEVYDQGQELVNTLLSKGTQQPLSGAAPK